MDLLAFFSGICVATLAYLAGNRFFTRPLPPIPLISDELNTLHAKVDALASRRLESPGRLHEKRAELMANLYTLLVALHRRLTEAHLLQTAQGQLYLGGRGASERDIEQKLERELGAALEAFREFVDALANHRIYFDSALIAGVEPVSAALQRLSSGAVTGAIVRKGDDGLLRNALTETAAAMRVVELRFKETAGFD
jgi:hypothetical protein